MRQRAFRADILSLPLEHLSASSISKFQRCPRQWQEYYLREAKGPANSALVIGSAVHLGLSRCLKGESPGNYFEDAVATYTDGIDWKRDTRENSRVQSERMLWDYYEKVGKYLDVVSTEQEILVEIPGVDIPLLGYVDIQTKNGIIDVKTTGYFRRQPELNPEWKLQMNIYQMQRQVFGEFHIITRSKTTPVVTPTGYEDPLSVEPPDKVGTQKFLQQTYEIMKHYWETWGKDEDWPGNLVHPWAAKYCGVENCCQRR